VKNLLVALLLLALTAIVLSIVFLPQRPGSANPSPTAAAITDAPTTTADTATSAPASTTTCQIRGVLPDPSCTPGATDPRVTQDNITSTICVPGYTRTVRPPVTYTNALKIDQMRAYGMTNLTPRDVEEDHQIPLELGGHPTDPKNLWPEPRRSVGGQAETKDELENRLHALVCAGRMTLIEAQQCIAVDWVECDRRTKS
jgi:hypothetical protein